MPLSQGLTVRFYALWVLSLLKGEWLSGSWFDKALLSVVEGLTTNGLT